jgi:hypothetical protein
VVGGGDPLVRTGAATDVDLARDAGSAEPALSLREPNSNTIPAETPMSSAAIPSTSAVAGFCWAGPPALTLTTKGGAAAGGGGGVRRNCVPQ